MRQGQHFGEQGPGPGDRVSADQWRGVCKLIEERLQAIRVLQSATRDGGVHLVETIVAGCTCDYGRAARGIGKRPTSWNGQRYVVPKDAAGAAPAGSSSVVVTRPG